MMYLTYLEYQTYGGNLSEQEFNTFEFEAESIINWYTFNRLKNDDTYPTAVKRCVYQLINIAQQAKQAMSLGVDQNGNTTAAISSQSNDGVSVSFNTLTADQALQTTIAERERYILTMLNGVTNEAGRRLLYRGVYPDDE